MSLIYAAMLTTTNKNVVEEIPKVVAKTDEEYYNQCLKSVRCKWLLQAMYHESRGESDKGVVAVGYVILNRVKHPTLWPNTIAGVIKQRRQFSYRFDGSLEKGFTEKKQYIRIAVLAAKVLEGSVANPVGKAVYYHRYDISTQWSKKKKLVSKIGSHNFYQ